MLRHQFSLRLAYAITNQDAAEERTRQGNIYTLITHSYIIYVDRDPAGQDSRKIKTNYSWHVCSRDL